MSNPSKSKETALSISSIDKSSTLSDAAGYINAAQFNHIAIINTKKILTVSVGV